MYVTEEFVDYRAKEVVLHGFSFSYTTSGYADSFWFDSDADKEWTIPLKRWNEYIKATIYF